MLCTAMETARDITKRPAPQFGTTAMSSPIFSDSPRVIGGSGGSSKRGRGDEEGTSQPFFFHIPIQTDQIVSPPPSVTPKKTRANNYEAPRAVKPSILSAMGSLVGGANTGDSNSSVPLRRRLSGGHLEEFIGDHDRDDMETESSMHERQESRPRSMSF